MHVGAAFVADNGIDKGYVTRLAKHMHQCGGLFSMQLGRYHPFWKQAAVQREFGKEHEAVPPWKITSSDGCQFGMKMTVTIRN